MTIRSLAVLLVLLGSSGAFAPAVAAASDLTVEASELRLSFDKACKYYEQYVLPNSMAREPGFDLNSHLNKLFTNFQSEAKNFSRPAGELYLLGRLDSQTDDVLCSCAAALLVQSQLATGITTKQIREELQELKKGRDRCAIDALTSESNKLSAE